MQKLVYQRNEYKLTKLKLNFQYVSPFIKNKNYGQTL